MMGAVGEGTAAACLLEGSDGWTRARQHCAAVTGPHHCRSWAAAAVADDGGFLKHVIKGDRNFEGLMQHLPCPSYLAEVAGMSLQESYLIQMTWVS